MCGIFGIIHFNDRPIDTLKAEQAAKAISYRGPDDYGTFLSQGGYTFFSHYRLSIIELSKLGHQPMTSSDGRYTIMFNGEIYNYLELKEHLLKTTGVRFRTNSDTEVLLNLYAEEKENCLKFLRGMFAFAVWDEKEKSLFAARDRFGIKPLYYLINKDEFILSSELKAIKKYKENLTISRRGIEEFLKTGSVPAPLTIYNETKSLLPGEFIKVNFSGGYFLKKWWHFEEILNFPEENYDSDSQQEIRTSLIDSIKVHCVSDVEVGAFLSGGIDSTSVVSLMKKAGQQKIRTLSVTFPGNKLDESQFAKKAAEKYCVEHTEYRITETDVLNNIEFFFSSVDQPTIDGLNTWFISKAASDIGLKVVMSGLGGDELFGGYSTFRYIPMLEFINRIPFSGMAVKAASLFIKSLVHPKAYEYLRYNDDENASYRLFRGLFTNEEINELYNDNLPSGFQESQFSRNNEDFNIYDSTFITRHSALKYVSYLEATNYLTNQLLRDSDTFSMHHSLELRVPFIDDRLYFTVMKYIDKGYDKNNPKIMLIDAVGDLPEEIINRTKMGFTFPFDEWLRDGRLGSMVKDYISDNDSLNKKGVENLIVEFNAGRVHWSRLWALFVLTKFNGM